MLRSTTVVLASIASACTLIPAAAQWTQQTLTLAPGWNAIHVEVEVPSNRCEAVFAGVPVESVWMWNRRFQPMQFLLNPDELLPQQPDWRTWFPAGHPQAFLDNLHMIRAGYCYLVKLADDAQPVKLVLTGCPVLPAQAWYPDSYNLVGFPVRDDSALTFAEYFAPSPAHADTRIHTLADDGTWQQIKDTRNAVIERGRAYWVWCDGPCDYAGPMAVSVGGADVLSFGSERTDGQVQIENLERRARAYTVRLLPSAPVPADAGAAGSAGPLLLSYWHAEYEPPRFSWEPLPAQLNYQVEAGGLRRLALSVRRAEMPASPGAQYQGLLEISDERGLRVLVPMNADGAVVTADTAPFPRDGLWVGGVILDRVSEVNSNSIPLPTPAPLGFRLIVHQDSNGVVRLLSEATEVLADESDGTLAMILSDGRTLAQYVDPSDAGSVIARYSAVAFNFRGPRLLSYNASSEALSGTLTLGYDDPLNPFKHLYHPDHNNLENYRTELAEGVESYTVTRDVAMKFSATPVAGASTAGWGDTITGGEYTESVKGLYHDELATAGTFILKHVSSTTILK